MSILNVVRENLEPIILNMGLNVWDIQFEKEGTSKFLRVYIFKKNGDSVTLDDCEMVSYEVSKKLDEIDVVKEKYFLEVSSIGIDRKLAKEIHFKNSIGRHVNIKFKKTFEGKKHLKGILKSFKDGEIELQTMDEIFNIPIKNCSFVKLDGESEWV